MSEPAAHPARRAVFLDRDGTVNVEKNYLFRSCDWEWIPGAVSAIQRINALGLLAIIVTNQAGVARGLYSADDVTMLHQNVDEMLAAAGARIDAYYMCPHHPSFGDRRACMCRKPQPGMLFQAASDFAIELSGSYLVGDTAVDVQAGLEANVKPILVLTGYGARARQELPADILCVADLAAAVSHIADQAT